MMISWMVLIIIVMYFFLVFVVVRLVAPYGGFGPLMPPRQIPEEIKAAVIDLQSRATDQRSYLEAAYELVMDKNQHQWQHTRGQAAVRLPRLFVKDLGEIWATRDFIYCYAINYLLFVLLIFSKYFKPEDVKVRHVFLNGVAHNYLKVKVGNDWIDADPAGAGIRGFGLGHHASFFG